MLNTLLKGLSQSFVALFIVFAVLFILMLLISLFKVILYKEPKKPAQEAVQDLPAEDALNCDTQLVAVITAAITASMGQENEHSTFVIKTIKKREQWQSATRQSL